MVTVLLVRFELADDQVELLRTLGCSKLLQNYEGNTPDQRELYEAMGAMADTVLLWWKLNMMRTRERRNLNEDEGEAELE